jgi:hypothetical protein
VAEFKVLPLHLREGTQRNHRYLSRDGSCFGRNSNPALLKGKSEALRLEPTCSVIW